MGAATTANSRALGQDLFLNSVGWAKSYCTNESDGDPSGAYTDEWGVLWKNALYQTRFGKGFYTEIAGHPLADVRALDSYSPPGPKCVELYHEAEHVIASYKDDSWIVGVTVTTIFETAWALRGLERMLTIGPRC